MDSNAHRHWSSIPIVVLTAAIVVSLIALSRPLSAQQVTDKLSSILQDVVAAVPQQSLAEMRVQRAPVNRTAFPKSIQDAMHGRLLRMNANDEVQVYVLMDVTDDAVRQLTAAGATVEIRDAAHRRLQARAPAGQLAAIAALPFVNSIRTPSYGVHQHIGSVTTEGDAIQQADLARQQYSVDGTGVRVAVISDGIRGIFATGCTSCTGIGGGPISSNDLPTAVGTRNSSGVLISASGGITATSFAANGDLEATQSSPCSFTGSGAEGTAMLEIVHDLAPGAQLSFANADTDLAYQQAVNFLAASNDVVLDDLGFVSEFPDGTSAISVNTAAALNNASNPIRAYADAVGNSSDAHYLGSFVDSGIDGRTENSPGIR